MSKDYYCDLLHNLPHDWEKVTIEELGTIYSGGTPSRDEPSFWNGSIAWVTPGELTTLQGKWITKTREYITESGLLSSSAQLLPKGSLLVTTRATIGYVAIAATAISTNQGFKSLIVNQLAISNFYYHLFKFITPEIKKKSCGSTFPEISRQDFKSILVPQPPLFEQQQIAQILDTIDEAIARTSSLIAKLKQMKAGLLHDLLTRGLDENGKLRDAIAYPEQFKNSPLEKTPKDWEVTRLSQEINIIHGYAFKGEYFAEQPPGEILLVPGNFHREGGLYFDDNNTKYYQGLIPDGTVLDNGELLIVMTDLSPRTLILGRVVLMDLPFRVLHNQRIGKVLLKFPNTWNKKFLMLAMNSNRIRSNIIRSATGTTVRHTSPERIMANIVAKPSIEEQSRIVAILEDHDTRICKEDAYWQKLKLQKQGLMQDLLTGKVRVNHSQ